MYSFYLDKKDCVFALFEYKQKPFFFLRIFKFEMKLSLGLCYYFIVFVRFKQSNWMEKTNSLYISTIDVL